MSEPFANKHGVKAGDKLTLQLAGKSAQFLILDVYYDYASERGYIIMDRSTMLRYLPDPAPSNVAVYLKKGVDIEQGRRAVEEALAGRKLLILTNRTPARRSNPNLRPDLRHHLRAGSSSSVRRHHGRRRRAACAGHRSPA